jgi:hemolysin III
MIDVDGRPLGLRWSYSRDEILADGLVHAAGVALAVLGMIALLAYSAVRPGTHEFWTVCLYTGTLVAAFCASAAYNLWPISRTKWLLRRLDHASIYLLIAGTYTPFLRQVPESLISVWLLSAVWAVALGGAAIKFAWPGRLDRLSIGLCLALGWSGLLAMQRVVEVLPTPTLWLIVVGGLLYTGGVVFHIWHRLKFQNAIWHSFVLAASGCYFGAVFAMVCA